MGEIVRDASSDRKYFTMLPNFVTEIGLSPFALALYVRLKRRAGEAGECFENTRNLALGCGMSAGQVTKAKRELAEAGLIHIATEPGKHGGRAFHVITVTDIWARNAAHYAQNSTPEFPSSHSEFASSCGEPKNNPCKNKRGNNKPESNTSHEVNRNSCGKTAAGIDGVRVTTKNILRLLEKRHEENASEPAGPFARERVEEAIARARAESLVQVARGKQPCFFASKVLEAYDVLTQAANGARVDRDRFGQYIQQEANP